MYTFISVIILLACVLLVLVVLVQNSKGGGLAANFSGTGQVGGVRKTADFLEKATWTLASVLIGLSILASGVIPKKEERAQSQIKEQVTNTANPINNNMVPALPDLPQPTQESEPASDDENGDD